ncbi:uncharacterized protein K452DRAFT_283673 [Aplosporella prunicola CBS 121167]|uniref:Ketoreductase (KR) domain-containing protein n=1 Tax=Aplosporella prunicola CBS 121167 TaxID=1176127 RepID=A0A6A6BME8_9PEZI|nr:uncharacterized protein K452DRAFT_283673 [Aplosporella prunicola CBS 121167]KAF2145310.1 hypothetical protein K452DRAFT_283673 [Aplosporella prunicola CBS 121167]
MASKYTSKLLNHHVLILGGTSGIGFAVAEACIENGASVFLSGSTASKLSNAIQRLRTSYPEQKQDEEQQQQRIDGYVCDLSTADALETNVTALLDAATDDGTRKLNHVVFTAGDRLSLANIRDTTVAAVQAAGAVRFLGPLVIAKLAPAYMVSGPGSSITFTGGVNTEQPAAGWAIPAAYGSALDGMVRALVVDLKPLRVNIVAPGAVKTESWESLLPESELQSAFDKAAEKTTVGCMGRPEDVAEAYIYLMKDRFATGSKVSTDGGRLLA